MSAPVGMIEETYLTAEPYTMREMMLMNVAWDHGFSVGFRWQNGKSNHLENPYRSIALRMRATDQEVWPDGD